jgi:CHAT domain-containing protein
VIPTAEEALTKLVRAWRAAIEKRDVKAEPELAKAIYAALFSAVEKEGILAREKFSRLVLIGDGPLLDLPYAALLNGDGKRLVETAPLSVSCSLGVLLWPDDRERAASPIVIAADPVAKIGSRLPAARREGVAVSQLFRGAKLYVGEQATRKQVLPTLTSCAIIHFATHGLLDDEDGLNSGLLLADEPGQDGDPLLTANELINTRLSAQLAVLSACETGQGQKSGGEGLLGLTWAFRAAGCPCTVASLWSVDDEATSQLMMAFYTELIQQKRKDEAMRAAMLSVMKTRPQPFYWAAFQLNGDTTPLKL